MNLLLLGQDVWQDIPDYYNATAPHAETLAITAGAIMLFDCALASWLVSRLGGRWGLRKITVIALNVLIAAGFFIRMELFLQVGYWDYVSQRTVNNRPDAELIWRTLSWKGPAGRVPGELRILCIGDSSTAYGGSRQNYPACLQRVLRERFPGKRITVINGGIPGYTTYQGVRFLKRYGFECEPDALVVGYGFHDAFNELVEDKAYFSDNWVLAVREALFESQTYFVLRNWIVRVRHRGTIMTPRTTPRVSLEDYTANLESILDAAGKNHCRVAIVNMPLRRVPKSLDDLKRRPYHEVNVEIARSHHLPVIDAWLAWRQQQGSDSLFVPGHLNHLGPAGARALAVLVAERLIQAWPELFR